MAEFPLWTISRHRGSARSAGGGARRRGLQPKAFVDAHVRTPKKDWVPQNGARVVAKA